jgi:hypothetical protein
VTRTLANPQVGKLLRLLACIKFKNAKSKSKKKKKTK